MKGQTSSREGFTLMELMVALAITLVIVGAALQAFLQARRASDTASQLVEMNDNLRAGLDLIVRDLIQTGQGLPSGKVIDKPSGTGAVPIVRPGPVAAGLTFPVTDSEFPAVITGAGLGPAYRDGAATGPNTDIVTLVYVDSQFDGIACQIAANARVITVVPLAKNGGADITGPGVDDPVIAGDLIMVSGSEAGGGSALVMPTDVQGQSIHVDAGDPMGLNQQGTAAEGTLRQLLPTPAKATDAVFSRIRMVTYFIDTSTDPSRLMRQLNYGEPRAVANGVDNLQLSYDIADGVDNPTNVESPSVPNQIRKVNLYLSARSRQVVQPSGRHLRNSISTQVSLRSLAFVDRYQ